MANDENFEDDGQPVGFDGLGVLVGARRDGPGWGTARDNPELHSRRSRWNDRSVPDPVDLVRWP